MLTFGVLSDVPLGNACVFGTNIAACGERGTDAEREIAEEGEQTTVGEREAGGGIEREIEGTKAGNISKLSIFNTDADDRERG